jgi:hypothetical protein
MKFVLVVLLEQQFVSIEKKVRFGNDNGAQLDHDQFRNNNYATSQCPITRYYVVADIACLFCNRLVFYRKFAKIHGHCRPGSSHSQLNRSSVNTILDELEAEEDE